MGAGVGVGGGASAPFAVSLLLTLALAYGLGGLPSALWLGKLRGARIFEVGSGNMGAMNTARNLGYGLGAAVFALDVGKGAAATWLGGRLAHAAGLDGTGALLLPLAAGVSAVLGHVFSPWVGFRGGKGLATGLGVALPVYPLAALAALALLLALLGTLRAVTPATVGMLALYPAVAYAVELVGGSATRAGVIAAGVAGVAIVGIVAQWRALRARD